MLLLSYSCFSTTALCRVKYNKLFGKREPTKALQERNTEKKRREMSRCLTLVLVVCFTKYPDCSTTTCNTGCWVSGEGPKLTNTKLRSRSLTLLPYFYSRSSAAQKFFWIYFPTPWASTLGCEPIRLMIFLYVFCSNVLSARPENKKKGYNNNIQSEPC